MPGMLRDLDGSDEALDEAREEGASTRNGSVTSRRRSDEPDSNNAAAAHQTSFELEQQRGFCL